MNLVLQYGKKKPQYPIYKKISLYCAFYKLDSTLIGGLSQSLDSFAGLWYYMCALPPTTPWLGSRFTLPSTCNRFPVSVCVLTADQIHFRCKLMTSYMHLRFHDLKKKKLYKTAVTNLTRYTLMALSKNSMWSKAAYQEWGDRHRTPSSWFSGKPFPNMPFSLGDGSL